jgi:hypothetical protein
MKMDYIYIYEVVFRNAIGEKVTETYAAFDAEDLAEQFFKNHFHVDYDILGKTREYVNF